MFHSNTTQSCEPNSDIPTDTPFNKPSKIQSNIPSNKSSDTQMTY